MHYLKHRLALWAMLTLVLLSSCGGTAAENHRVSPTARETATVNPTASLPAGEGSLTADEIATLGSLEQLDDFPLYTMRYSGAYAGPVLSALDRGLGEQAEAVSPQGRQAGWGCALFAALGDPEQRVYGRNFDWRFSPALLLFTDPADGYASVSMVDMEYLGFAGERANTLTELPLEARRGLLEAPSLPFDGMNEMGLAIGMAAVPPGQMRADPNKKMIDQLAVMREILDHAATVDEAVEMLGRYNIDMGSVPLHYLVASTGGDATLVEFYQGKMAIFRNEQPWQLATNFLVAATGGQPQGQCPRYDRISKRLEEKKGRLTTKEAFDLLADVAQGGPQTQSSTQWSAVYEMTTGKVNIIMGRKYSGEVHSFDLREK